MRLHLVRRVFARVLAVISVLPGIAAADPIKSDEAWLRDIAFGDLKSELDGAAHASASAQAGRVVGPKANLGGEVAWNVGPCRALLAGGEGMAEGKQLSGSAWGGFCLPFPMNRMELIMRGDYELQPSLSSLPIAGRARYTGFSVEIRNTFVGWKGETIEHAIFPLTFNVGTFEQTMIDTGQVSFAIDVYRRIHTSGRIVQILPFAMRAAGPAIPAESGGMYLSSTAQEYAPFRITRTSPGSLGDFAIEADFAAGLAYAKLTDPPEGGMQMAPIRYHAYDLYADATVRATRAEDTFSLHLRRAFEPTFTDELLLDTRLDASWLRVHGKHTMLVGAFAASTRRMDRGGPIDTTPSGGLRGAYIYKLPYHTQLVLAGEVARSFYATLDDTLALDAAWSAQASATMSFATR